MAQKGNLLGTIAVIAMIILLLVNAYLLYNNFNQKKIIEQQKEQVIATNNLKLSLEKEYYKALSDLEELRGSNDELNEMIEEQKTLLKEQKTQIIQLIQENKNLDYVRQKIKEMKLEAEAYLQEIRSLKKKNAELTASNSLLRAKQDSLKLAFTEQVSKSDSLEALNKSTSIEKQRIEKKNKELHKKVKKAAAIDVVEIEAKGYKIARDGDLKRRRRAKNVDLIEVCFETTANEIAEQGTETFYIRIIDPLGKTMAVNSSGSGVLTELEGETQVRYTKSTRMRYNQSPAVGCIQWRPEIHFTEGIYEVEIYNKGYLVGKTTFNLR